MKKLLLIGFLAASSLFSSYTHSQSLELPGCNVFSYQSSISAADQAGGNWGIQIAAGDRFTFTISAAQGESAEGSWRLIRYENNVVGETLASGGTIPGTLTWTATSNEPTSSIGFYVESFTGSAAVNITGSCANQSLAPLPAATKVVPVNHPWALLLIGFAALVAGSHRLRRRH